MLTIKAIKRYAGKKTVDIVAGEKNTVLEKGVRVSQANARIDYWKGIYEKNKDMLAYKAALGLYK